MLRTALHLAMRMKPTNYYASPLRNQKIKAQRIMTRVGTRFSLSWCTGRVYELSHTVRHSHIEIYRENGSIDKYIREGPMRLPLFVWYCARVCTL